MGRDEGERKSKSEKKDHGCSVCLIVGNGKEGVEGEPQCICNEIVKDRERW